MNLIDINLSMARGAKVIFNGLYASKDPECLLHDLLLVELPDGTRIDVSWSPEMDPEGQYHVTAYRGTWSNRLAEAVTASSFDAARFVETMARNYSTPTGIVASSSGQTIVFPRRPAA